MPAKHVPLRTCIACGRQRPKREMVRVVRTPQGAVELDPTGKKAGRGAYICPDEQCWAKALKKGRLEHGLRGPVASSDLEQLRAVRPAANRAAKEEVV